MTVYTLDEVAELYRAEADVLLERADRVDIGFSADTCSRRAVHLTIYIGQIALRQNAIVTAGRRWTPALASRAAMRHIGNLIADADRMTGQSPRQEADRGGC